MKYFIFQPRNQSTELKTDHVAYRFKSNILDEASKTDFKIIIIKS